MTEVIQWFPGHMARARRQVAEQIRLADVVVEVVDARAPRASANPDLAELAAQRPRVVVLNKADLADPAGTREWLAYLEDRGLAPVALDAVRGRGVPDLLAAIRRQFQPELARLVARGRLPRAARAMVLGMPNVGKSSVINRLAGGRKAAVGDRPGVTRGQQWIRLHKDVELLDTPGILVPRIANPSVGILLAGIGMVKEEVFRAEWVAGALLPLLWRLAPGALRERLGLERLAPDAEANLAAIAGARGLLRPGGLPDTERAAQQFLRDVREGRLGRFTFERPDQPVPDLVAPNPPPAP